MYQLVATIYVGTNLQLVLLYCPLYNLSNIKLGRNCFFPSQPRIRHVVPRQGQIRQNARGVDVMRLCYIQQLHISMPPLTDAPPEFGIQLCEEMHDADRMAWQDRDRRIDREDSL